MKQGEASLHTCSCTSICDALLSMALRKKRLNGGGGANPGCIVCSRCTCDAWVSPAYSTGVQGDSLCARPWLSELSARKVAVLSLGCSRCRCTAWAHLRIIGHTWLSKLENMLASELASAAVQETVDKGLLGLCSARPQKEMA